MLPAVNIPGSAKGRTVTIQGVVVDYGDGAATFTRGIQISFS
jgi:hypothetical protein